MTATAAADDCRLPAELSLSLELELDEELELEDSCGYMSDTK